MTLTNCAERYQALFGNVGEPRAGGTVVRWGVGGREALAGDDAAFRGVWCGRNLPGLRKTGCGVHCHGVMVR